MSRYQHGPTQAAKKVLRKGPPKWQEEYSDWDFPPKPPWMRWKTCNRLDEKAQAYERSADAQLSWPPAAPRYTRRRHVPPDRCIVSGAFSDPLDSNIGGWPKSRIV